MMAPQDVHRDEPSPHDKDNAVSSPPSAAMNGNNNDSAEANGGTASSEHDGDAPPAKPATNPVRKIMLIALATLLVMFAYHVISDRITPYTSQATVDTLLVQIAPQVSGQVMDVGVTDNGTVKKGAGTVPGRSAAI